MLQKPNISKLYNLTKKSLVDWKTEPRHLSSWQLDKSILSINILIFVESLELEGSFKGYLFSSLWHSVLSQKYATVITAEAEDTAEISQPGFDIKENKNKKRV